MHCGLTVYFFYHVCILQIRALYKDFNRFISFNFEWSLTFGFFNETHNTIYLQDLIIYS